MSSPADTDQAPAGKALTIGAVCKALEREFPDISISKIRYLEDQKLLQPKRTAGGYRLYSQQDLGRLRTILRLQRDEFLPLRVIRQELAAGRTVEESPSSSTSSTPKSDGRPAPGRRGGGRGGQRGPLLEPGAGQSGTLAGWYEVRGRSPRSGRPRRRCWRHCLPVL